MGKPKELKMPKGKILMGKTTPPPAESMDKIDGKRSNRIMDMKGNEYLVDPKTGNPTLVKAGPKPKQVTPRPKPKPAAPPKPKQVTPRPRPKPVVPPKPKGKNPPSVVYKNMTPDIRYSIGGTIVDKVLPGNPGQARQSMPSMLRRNKPVTTRGGR